VSTSTLTGTGSSVSRKRSTMFVGGLNATMLILLAVQFLLGMLVNLFVQIPASHPGTSADNYFVGVVQGVIWALGNATLYLLLHVIIGLLLFLGSIVLLILSIVVRRHAWILVSVFGLLGIMAAGFNGASFMNYGHDFSSLLMSIGFLLTAIPYTIGLTIRPVQQTTGR
jgi:hypothetical protein